MLYYETDPESYHARVLERVNSFKSAFLKAISIFENKCHARELTVGNPLQGSCVAYHRMYFSIRRLGLGGVCARRAPLGHVLIIEIGV
jgi:hypothetical protein